MKQIYLLPAFLALAWAAAYIPPLFSCSLDCSWPMSKRLGEILYGHVFAPQLIPFNLLEIALIVVAIFCWRRWNKRETKILRSASAHESGGKA